MVSVGLAMIAVAAPVAASSVHAGATLPDDPAVAGVASVSSLPSAMDLAPGETVTATLYEGTTLFSGVSFTQFQLSLPAAGNLQVRLEDLGFPVAAGALNLALVEGGRVLEVLSGTGAFSLDVGGPTRLFAFVYAVGAPGVSVGSYFLSVQHTYQHPIPLPASLWLLLSGAAWAGWVGNRRQRREAI